MTEVPLWPSRREIKGDQGRKEVRVTDTCEVGITWAGTLHLVDAGSVVSSYPVGHFAPALCNNTVAVLVDYPEHSNGQRWDMRWQQLSRTRRGENVPRTPYCKTCRRMAP